MSSRTAKKVLSVFHGIFSRHREIFTDHRLNVIAITDHDHLDSSLWAYSQQGHYPFDIVPGIEVISADGQVFALWITRPIPKRLSLAETIAAIHEQPGGAVLARPFEPTIALHAFWRYYRPPEGLIKMGIDAVETYNAGALTPGNDWLAGRVFHPLEIAVVGNSDAHSPACTSGITRFPGRTAAEARLALARRQMVSEGISWPLTLYLMLSINSLQKRLNASSEPNMPSTHPTHL